MKSEIIDDSVGLFSPSPFWAAKTTIQHETSAPCAARLLGQTRTVVRDTNDPVPVKLRRQTFRLQRICAVVIVLALATLQTLLANSPVTLTTIQGLNIEQVGQWPGYSRGPAVGLVVQNDLACVAAELGRLIIMNISNPAAPAPAGRYETSGEAQDVALSGDYVYVADGSWDSSRLRVVENAEIAPQIVTQPESQTVSVGTSVFFSVNTIGSLPLTHQWSKDGVALADGERIKGATSSTLMIVELRAEDAGQYNLTVSNALGSVASQNATLTVRAPIPGNLKWDFDTGGFVFSSPAIGSFGMVYVGGGYNNNKLYALDSATGAKKWEFVASGWVYSTPAIGSDGTVYVGSWDNKVYALDGATGAKKWEFATGRAVHSSPAISSDGTVYVCSADNKLYAVDGATGAKKWDFATGREVFSSPAIGSDGTVYVGSLDNKLYALDGATGVKKWEFATGRAVHSSPAISSDGTVYVGSADNKLYAVDGATGAKKWDFATGREVFSSPAIGSDGTVYVGSLDNKLYAVLGSAPLAQTAWPMLGHDARHTGNVAFSEPQPLSFRDSRIDGGEFKVRITGAPGQRIVIERSDDLRNWAPVSTNTLSALGVMDLAEPLSPNLDKQFYRLRAQF